VGQAYKGVQDVREWLFENADHGYADFQRKLIPDMQPERVIGVRTPLLRGKARELRRLGCELEYLDHCAHGYFEENQLCGFIISGIKDFDECVGRLEAFFPYMDNWATCDQTSPAVFAGSRDKLLPLIETWLGSGQTYVTRFAIGMLMKHFLGEAFKTDYVEMLAGLHSGEYYVNMEIAWYIATALDRQWAAVVPYLEQNRFDAWVHRKAIQKALESRRITPDEKIYLKKLRNGGYYG
jgi:3-methyladenine DNA glycosylase AlkD